MPDDQPFGQKMLCPTPSSASISRFLFIAATLLFIAFPIVAAETNKAPSRASQTGRAMKAITMARSRFRSETNSPEAAWQLGRACFDLAELANDNSSKADVANEGIAACRKSIALNSNSAPAHYYLGMTLGQLADTKRNLSALRMVRDMEHEFLLARGLDEPFDFAGPDRNLGLLYDEAPSFGSIGSRNKARLHLQRAAELAPDYPENRLNLLEAYLRWGDRAAAFRELKALETLWPAAQKKFSDEEWAASWPEWQNRLDAAKRKLESAPKTFESPRNSD
jgi:tetratricopeptide (TPR) repeat protein